MVKRDSLESKNNILKAAERLFAEKGFDGTRVDDIAAEAGVNKALIYYYFKSKDEILEVLFDNLISEAKTVVNSTLEHMPDMGIEENYKRLITMYLSFATEKKNIIKIALAESLKSGSKKPIILTLGEILVEAETANIRKAYESKGIKYERDVESNRVIEFFTGFMPIIAYSVFQGDWQKNYNMTIEAFTEEFINAYKISHLASHFIRSGHDKK